MCAGITGPDDPVRLQRQADQKGEEARRLRIEAMDLEKKAEEGASRMRHRAHGLDVERTRILAQLRAE